MLGLCSWWCVALFVALPFVGAYLLFCAHPFVYAYILVRMQGSGTVQAEAKETSALKAVDDGYGRQHWRPHWRPLHPSPPSHLRSLLSRVHDIFRGPRQSYVCPHEMVCLLVLDDNSDTTAGKVQRVVVGFLDGFGSALTGATTTTATLAGILRS